MSAAIRDTFLKVLHQKTSGTIGAGVPIQQIADDIISSLREADTAALRAKISWLASQDLKAHGLISSTRRGEWALTSEGLATIIPMHQINTEVIAQTSDWLTDNAGVPFPFSFEPAPDTDPYILGLLVKETKCFSNIDPNNKTCDSCSLRAECLAAWIQKLPNIRDEIARQEGISKTTLPVEDKLEGDNFEDILKELGGTTTTAPTPRWTPQIAEVDSICNLCHQIIREGTEGRYIIGDFRHIYCV